MKIDWEKFIAQAKKELTSVKRSQELEEWRIKYLGRKSDLSLFFSSLSNLPLAERKREGMKANEYRHLLYSLYEEKKKALASPSSSDFLDISQPGEKIKQGHLHPLTLITRQIVSVFEKMGFAIIEGPEIETEYYNFDALNIPANHPARDMWDTLWLKDPLGSFSGKSFINKKTSRKSTNSRLLLRTHTSPEQIHYMETHQPPFRIIAPGRCFRHEATDSSHEIQFHQLEGLMVGEKVNLANFKAIIELAIRSIFQNKVLIRFRPSYFPFVSPGVEVDIKLKQKSKKGGNNDWMEIIGAGMVHPFLFSEVGYVPGRWQGFAFGLGIERIAMIKYHIDDIRLFFNPDIRFLEQF